MIKRSAARRKKLLSKLSVNYHVLKVNEGGLGQVFGMHLLKEAGLDCERGYSQLMGHSGIRVYGNKRVQAKASKILFGRF